MYYKRYRKRDGDVLLFSKIMKFQNIKVWERWVVVCVIGVYLKEGFYKRDEERYRDV